MGLFEVPKPLSTLGIGVDLLPEQLKNSTILTGNDLGMLANVEVLPSGSALVSDKESVHNKAHKLLQEGHILEAWDVLVSN